MLTSDNNTKLRSYSSTSLRKHKINTEREVNENNEQIIRKKLNLLNFC